VLTARLAHDQLATQPRVAWRKVATRHTLEHHAQRYLAQLLRRLPQSGERNRKEFRVFDIVDPHQAHVIRNANAQPTHRVHQTPRGAIVRAHNPLRALLGEHRANAQLVRWVESPRLEVIKQAISRIHRLAESGCTGIDSVCAVGLPNENDAPCAE
jgi:hypothetical protein